MTSRSGGDGTEVRAIVRALHFGAALADSGAALADSGAAAAGGADGDAQVRTFRFATDYDAPERWPDVPYDTASPASRHDVAARARTAAVLADAARTMALRVPAAFDLVNAQMQRVLLRSSDGRPGTSTSHRDHVGRCLLTNLHASAAAVPVAIEALTHEAIHQLLYRAEQAQGAFCDLAETPTFRSPWSGARLPLHSLVHASFVWYGLLTLWTALALVPASDDDADHARGRVAHCLFGFAFLDDLLASPGFPVASVSPPVLDAIRGMAAAARRATQAAEPAATLRQAASARAGAGWPAALAAGLASAPG